MKFDIVKCAMLSIYIGILGETVGITLPNDKVSKKEKLTSILEFNRLTKCKAIK